MAIINNSHKFVFVHIPKSAGTSVTRVFSKYTNYCDLEIGGTEFGEKIQPAYIKRFGLGKHATAKELKCLMGAVEWSKYFTFTFVRNPYARAFSMYNFLRKFEFGSQAFSSRMLSFESFDEFVDSGFWYETPGPFDAFRPQTYWLREKTGSDQFAVKYVARVETMEDDVANILATLGIKGADGIREKATPRLNASTKPSEFLGMSQASAANVLRKYKEDFELFGYSEKLDALTEGSAE